MLALVLLVTFAAIGFLAGRFARRRNRAWISTVALLLLAFVCLGVCPILARDSSSASREVGRVFLGASYFLGVACAASISSNFTNNEAIAALQAALLSIAAAVLLFLVLGPLGCGWFGDCL